VPTRLARPGPVLRRSVCCRRLRPWSHSFFPCPSSGRRPAIFAAGLAGARTFQLELFGRRAAAAVDHWSRGALRAGRSVAPDGYFPRPFGAAGRFHAPLPPAFAGRSDLANHAGSPHETWIAALHRFGSAGFSHVTAEEVDPQLEAFGQGESLRPIRPIGCARARADAAHRPGGHPPGPPENPAAASVRHAHADLSHVERLGAVNLQREILGETAQIDPQPAPVYAVYPLLPLLRLAPADLVAAFAPRCRRVDFSPERTHALASHRVVREEILGEILQIGPPCAVAAACRDPLASLAHRCVRASVLREKARRWEAWADPLPTVAGP
jgi:hypothetical protein